MAEITQRIQEIRDYPKLGDSHDVFRKKADIAWSDLATAIPQINQFGLQTNYLRQELNNWRNEVYNWRNDTLNAKNQTYGYKIDAVSAWNNIKNYSIPKDATYNKDAIDEQIDEITRVLTALTITTNQLSQNEILLERIKNIDGNGSGIDADLIRGLPADFTCSKEQNGFTKLPNGLILQWGQYIVNSNSDASHIDGEIEFIKKFPNVCFQVIATTSNGPNNNWGAITIYTKDITTSKFSFGIDSTDPDQHFENDVVISYFAIGY